MSRDRAARKLVGLITRRSLVQIQLPQPFEKRGLLTSFFCECTYCILLSGLICTGSVIFLGKYRTQASFRGRNLSHHVCFKSVETTHLILTRV